MRQRSVVPSSLAGLAIGRPDRPGPRIGYRTSKDFTPARPFKPTMSRAQPLPVAAGRSRSDPSRRLCRMTPGIEANWPHASDPIRRLMIDPKVATIETPSGKYAGKADSRPNRERCPEMLHGVGPAHFHAWAQWRFCSLLGTAAIHDLSLPIPFERAILPRNYPKSGGNVGQGAVIGSTLCITGGAWTSFDAHRD